MKTVISEAQKLKQVYIKKEKETERFWEGEETMR